MKLKQLKQFLYNNKAKILRCYKNVHYKLTINFKKAIYNVINVDKKLMLKSNLTNPILMFRSCGFAWIRTTMGTSILSPSFEPRSADMLANNDEGTLSSSIAEFESTLKSKRLII